MKMSENRFCLVQDESCHWYCIPVEKKKLFNQLCIAMDDIEVSEKVYKQWDKAGFDKCRLDMHPSNYSFVDLQEIKS